MEMSSVKIYSTPIQISIKVAPTCKTALNFRIGENSEKSNHLNNHSRPIESWALGLDSAARSDSDQGSVWPENQPEDDDGDIGEVVDIAFGGRHLLCEVFLQFWGSETKSADGATIQAGQSSTLKKE